MAFGQINICLLLLVTLRWHQRYDDDPAHRWLRGLVRAAVRRVAGEELEEGR